ncbi:MAG TPA: single-stranded DNA-binding protein [Acidimicrobiia bacterium]
MSLDINLVVLRGRLAADPECRVFDSGSRLIRYLVTIRSEQPRKRVDVVPVTLWDPPDDLWDHPGTLEDGFWAVGSVQRRYWEGPEGRRSRIEVVAEQVVVEDAVASALAGEAGERV